MTVHVWGAPEERGLELDEKLCDDTGEAFVVFHINPKWLSGVGTDWTCASCGYTTEETPLCGVTQDEKGKD